MTTQAYHAASVILIEQAEAKLAQGDVRQASEKGWGAAAQVVKAIAEQRGWPHQNHASLYRVIDRLVLETDDEIISNLFHIASALHQNFYEDWDSAENVARALKAVRVFIEMLSPLLAR